MASRESQGLQIALIIFVMVTVVLAVMTFVFYRKQEELNKTVADAQQKEKAAKENYDLENFKVQYLKHILGASTLAEAELNLVRDSVVVDDDMKVIEEKGGFIQCFKDGWVEEQINEARYKYAEAIENNEMTVVGMNQFEEGEDVSINIFRQAEDMQAKRISVE